MTSLTRNDPGHTQGREDGPDGLRAIAIHTDTHPGFMTDWQSPLFVLMTQAEGMSVLHETVFEDRIRYPAMVVAAMGGEIGLDSEVGAGSTFTLSIPLLVALNAFFVAAETGRAIMPPRRLSLSTRTVTENSRASRVRSASARNDTSEPSDASHADCTKS